MKFRDLIKILEENGFTEMPHKRGSHGKYKGTVKNQNQIVIVACHNLGDDIAPGTLGSMIR